MTAPARIKEADLVRVFRAAKKAEYPQVRVTIDVTGNMIIFVGEGEAVEPVRQNPLDRILTRGAVE